MKITNFIQCDGDDNDTASGKGLITTIERELPITATPFSSSHPLAPTHRVHA